MKIDVEFLKILLEDKTTGKNILWATSDYKNIAGDEEVQLEQINLIKLRFEKFREQQKIEHGIKQKFLRHLGYVTNKTI